MNDFGTGEKWCVAVIIFIIIGLCWPTPDEQVEYSKWLVEHTHTQDKQGK